ncbi:hypothetical protein [Haloplanus halobius]|uniref:hypothetical protein n=1 Tax=Haloplanus halobius TaxID=2934938 RepID=UPI00200FB7A8|nr:hypothetical protein [Haloplanus sp. XH21]
MTDRNDGTNETDLTPATIDELVDEYERDEPFDLVEREHTETLPPVFADGAFGRRGAEWVVQWYYRRRQRVGSVSDAERRAAESQFLDNDYEAMVDAIQGAARADAFETKVERLTALTGVDIAVAAAFLAFTHPDRYVSVDPRAWRALRVTGELDGSYPTDLTADDYERYLEAVRAVADRADRDPWTVYRALWQLGGKIA